MLTFTSTIDPRLTNLPPTTRPVVITHLRNMEEIFGGEPDHFDDGFVAYIEPQDTLQNVRSETGRDITDLESVFRDGPCLIGVLLWGNSGAGVTLVCLDLDGYAPEIVRTMREHL